MLDGHIHIERGDYTLEWIFRFANKALEHCYRFKEFIPMYDSVCEYSKYKQLGNKEEFDFILGSVHYVDNFAFDHKSEHWNTVN